ncbi:hypothetical protein [Brevibacillus dissolubilis]|uniref:hypothetical protein n=1 Tax=Brevibacillus dissolubilis TaxID=1844116 RepID=UPI00159B908D|nr:hypothetical protein [Brevibacillus dissolubilis]
MEASLSNEQVISRIQQIHQKGGSLGKKSVKSSDPELMRNALYYFPSWDNAIKAAGVE